MVQGKNYAHKSVNKIFRTYWITFEGFIMRLLDF